MRPYKMKRLEVVTIVCFLVFSPLLIGCGGGDPNAGGSALPTAGLNNGAGQEEDPNGGVGFDDESLGTDGQ